MKKIFKGMAMMVALVGILFLASCGKVTKSFADEINSAVSNGEHLQLEEVMEKLGTNASFTKTGGQDEDGTGYVMAIKGVEVANTTAMRTFKEKLTNKPNTKIEVMKIQIKDYLATSATYFKGSLEEGQSFDAWFDQL